MKLAIPKFSYLSRVLLASLCLSIIFSGLNSTLAAENRWEKAIQKFEKQDQTKPPKEGGIMFLGSSTIVGWDLKRSFPEMELVNRGFGGSQISDSLYFFDRIVMPHRPRLIVSYMGGNDLAAGESVEMVVGDFKSFVKKLHEKLPETRFVYLSIKLCKNRWGNREKIREANRKIREICSKDPLLDFIDLAPVTLGEDGLPHTELYRKDQLHFNNQGYDHLAELVKPYLTADKSSE